MWVGYWGPQGLPWKENSIPSTNKDLFTRELKKWMEVVFERYACRGFGGFGVVLEVDRLRYRGGSHC